MRYTVGMTIKAEIDAADMEEAFRKLLREVEPPIEAGLSGIGLEKVRFEREFCHTAHE